MPFVEDNQEFHARQGGKSVEIDGMIYYSNGARREVGQFGVRIEPPTDPLERAQLILTYWEERVKRAEGEFNETRDSLISHTKHSERMSYPPPAPEEVDNLRRMLRAVKKLQARRDAARDEVKRLTRPWKRKDRNPNRNELESQKVLGELHDIRL